MNLKCVIYQKDEILNIPIDEFYALYDTYYEGLTFESFKHTFYNKDYLITLYDNHQKVCGFTTVEVIHFAFNHKPRCALFSGDTIVNHKFWGQQILSYEWCKLAGKIKLQLGQVPLYWFLISKGHRTYRFLNNFSKDYYPSAKVFNKKYHDIVNYLALKKYPKHYNPEKGIIEFEGHSDYLRPAWQLESSLVVKNKYAKYFETLNPGYMHGDELVCLTELHQDNLRSIALKGFCKGMTESHVERDLSTHQTILQPIY